MFHVHVYRTEPVQIRDYRGQRSQQSEPSRKEATLFHKETGQ
ncbi:unnamed protein product [Brugia pahangi]|uniref:Transposase n=1 Tax=Brugia pahangi TaxID=6280 RepID=A0A0N4TFF9_BRUPA|nr:unnamed protein product [Brugia pahangi]